MMSRLTIFLFLFTALLFAQQPSALLEEANGLYREKNYELALEKYQQVSALGYESAELYFNTGNAWYRLGQLGRAMLHYQRALKLAPGDEDILHNIEIIQQQALDRVDQVPPIFIYQWWDALASIFTVNGWTIVAYSFFLLFLTALTVMLLSRYMGIKRIAFFISAVFLLLLFLAASLFYTKYDKDIQQQHAVILASEAAVKYSPDVEARDAFVVHEALTVKIEDSVEDWYEIRLSDGNVGWIKSEALEII